MKDSIVINAGLPVAPLLGKGRIIFVPITLGFFWIILEMARNCRFITMISTFNVLLALLLSSMILDCAAYRPGDIVPMSKMGQYHSVYTLRFYNFSLLLYYIYDKTPKITDLICFCWCCYLIQQSRTVWHDMIGRHCPIFGVNREVIFPVSVCIELVFITQSRMPLEFLNFYKFSLALLFGMILGIGSYI